MERLEKIYTDTVFWIVRIIFLVGCFIGLLFAMVAAVDLAFDLRWGFTWQTIPGGIMFALAAYGGSLFIKKISDFYGRIRG